ncbi:hypothetical protein ACHAXS_004692 [Conticribra weissflogii]
MKIPTPPAISTTSFIMSILLATGIPRLLSSTTTVAAFAAPSSSIARISSPSFGPRVSHRRPQSTQTTPLKNKGNVKNNTISLPRRDEAKTSLLSTPAEEIDPYSETARNDLAKLIRSLPPRALSLMGYDDIESDAAGSESEKKARVEDIARESHKSLLKLTEHVLDWNQRLNLVSRKDCNANVVYHRHVLPSVALLPLILENYASDHDDDDDDDDDDVNANRMNRNMDIVDVGTGGGFPGLPLSLLLPRVRFTLVDSVQKKLVAVSEMAAEMEAANVRVHWGRVEEMDRKKHGGVYDVVVGRSVTALPRYCAWISPLLKRKTSNGGHHDNDEQQKRGEEGRLIYIIGGELEDVVESRILKDVPLDRLLHREEGTTDKRALVFRARDVREIAEESGESKKVVMAANKAGSGVGGGKKKSVISSNNNDKNNVKKSVDNKKSRGEWSQKRNDVKKDRGYDNFKRYEF